MICRVCLTGSDTEIIPIFGAEGRSLNIATILGKHFWFQPQADDPISTTICYYCWIVVSNFDEFYRNVQTVQLKHCKQNVWIKEEVEEGDEEVKAAQTASKLVREFYDNDEAYQYSTESTVLLPVKNFALDDVGEDAVEEEDVLAEVQLCKYEAFNESPINVGCSEGADDEKDDDLPNDASSPDELKSDSPPSPRLRRTRGRSKKSSPKEFANERYVSTDTENELDSAETCKTKENRKSEYERRMRDFDEEIGKFMELHCDICQVKEQNFAALRTHMQNAHQSSAYVICCNRKFKKRIHLADHIQLHLKPDSFKCEECGKLFASKRSMFNHGLLKHMPDEEKPFQCEHCPERFAKSYFLEQHRMKHEDRIYKCGFCQRSFANPTTFKSHLKIYHGEGGIMCDICAKVIPGRTAFARHQMEHTGVTDPKVQCEQCGSWLKNKVTLRKHMLKHRIDDGVEYKCPICGKLAPHLSALKRHQRNVHILERRYECTLCKKAFKKALNLKEHMTTHTGEVLYQCPHCTKTFNSNANMHSHRKKMHPIEFEETRRKRMEQFLAPNPF